MSGLAVDSDGRVRCIWHDDKRRGRASAMRRRGGKKGARIARRLRGSIPPPPKTLDDAVQLASWLTHAVLAGNVTPKAAQEATRAVAQFTRGLAARDMTDRVRELEAQIKRFKRGANR
jgi:hypothetical protein